MGSHRNPQIEAGTVGEKSVVMINALRQSLNDLVATSETIKMHTAQLLPDDRRSSIAFQPQWWELWRNTPQNRLDRYIIEQQASWLGELRDTIGLMSEILPFMADDCSIDYPFMP